jgi:hypothetical protein
LTGKSPETLEVMTPPKDILVGWHIGALIFHFRKIYFRFRASGADAIMRPQDRR